VRRGLFKISDEALAASRPQQPTALLVVALRTPEPYFSLRQIRFRQACGHGPAAAMGAFHQQSVRLYHVAAPNLWPWTDNDRKSEMVPLDTDAVHSVVCCRQQRCSFQLFNKVGKSFAGQRIGRLQGQAPGLYKASLQLVAVFAVHFGTPAN
jgi:hypothetical protein